MPDLDSLRQEAEAAIAAAPTSAEVEELRVRFLGRRSELTRSTAAVGFSPWDNSDHTETIPSAVLAFRLRQTVCRAPPRAR